MKYKGKSIELLTDVEFSQYRAYLAQQRENEMKSEAYFEEVRRNAKKLRLEAEEDERKRRLSLEEYNRRKEEIETYQNEGRDAWQQEFEKKWPPSQHQMFSYSASVPSSSSTSTGGGGLWIVAVIVAFLLLLYALGH